MAGNSILDKIWSRISKYGFNLAMGVVAAVVLFIPLQHYISLGRYQHVGISIFLFGMGYVMQMIWSWRTWSKWAKISNAATSLFFCSVGIFFFSNSWMDNTIADPTSDKIALRSLFACIYLFFALIVSLLWMKSLYEDGKLEEQQKKLEAAPNTISEQKTNDTTTT